MSNILAFDPRRRGEMDFGPTSPKVPNSPKVTPGEGQSLGGLGSLGGLEGPKLCDPDLSCLVCGGGNFHQPPGDLWQCSTCTPPILPPAHLQARWSFCSVPDSPATSPGALTKLTKPLLPMPPPPPGERAVYLVEVLPDNTAPIGECRGCWFKAHMSARGLCGLCELARVLEAGRRAVESPAALADPAETMLHPRQPPNPTIRLPSPLPGARPGEKPAPMLTPYGTRPSGRPE
jgi:hypothetical protein